MTHFLGEDPLPQDTNPNKNLHMWVIKGYKIWAETYQKALEYLILIENA